MTAGGLRVGFLAYCSVLPRGYEATPARPGVAPLRARTFYEQVDWQAGTPPRIVTLADEADLAALTDDVRALRERADVVVVSVHWGIHFEPGTIAGYQYQAAHAAIDAGADVVLGHHGHVIKAVEFYRGKPVFHSLGNVTLLPRGDAGQPLTEGGRVDAQLTMVAKLTLGPGGVSRVAVIPCWLDLRLEAEVIPPGDPRFAEFLAYLRRVNDLPGTPRNAWEALYLAPPPESRALHDTEFTADGGEVVAAPPPTTEETMSPRDSQIRAETVGSLLRSPEALRAAASRAPGDAHGLGDPVLDAAVLDAVKLQQAAGVDVITDGELRRSNWADTPDFLDCFDKIAGNTGGLRWRGGANGPAGGHAAAYDTVARRVATARRLGDRSAQYAFLAGHAGMPTKFTLPAPSYHRRYWWPEVSGAVYGSAEEYLTEIRDALREVVDQVVALGCGYIQLDAPNYGSLCDPDNRSRLAADGVDVDAMIDFDAALDSSLFDGLSGVTRAVHVCRGNAPGGRWHSAGGYGAISARLFPRLAVDRLLLEYDTERAGAFGPLADVPSGVIAVLGLLTTKSGELEDPAAVRARIAEAATLKPLDELAVSTQCGFASVAVGNPITPDQQLGKLELVATLARTTWPS